MRLVVRWSIAAVVSLAAFVGSWWVCEAVARLGAGTALGIASAVLAVVVAVAGGWAVRDPPCGAGDANGSGGAGVRVQQSMRAKIVYAADVMTVNNYREPGK
jgi:hypothetical protein